MNDKQKRIVEILAEVVERPVDSIKPEQDLKADLELDSEPGRGTRMQVFLPSFHPAPKEEAAACLES